MTDFHKVISTHQAAASLRALMQAWRIPRHYQGELRQKRQITVNGQYQSVAAPVARGSRVDLSFSAAGTDYVRSPTPIRVVFENDDFLIVDKPAGIKTHPNKASETDTMVNRVAGYLQADVYITHRLDMETQGLMIFAKDPLTQAIINRELATRVMHRFYQADVAPGIPARGTIDAPIGHADDDVRKREVRADGLPARTHYTRMAQQPGFDTVHVVLDTGRTHQIRVHMAHIGHPIIGDPLYGGAPADHLHLTAYEIKLIMPFSATERTFTR
ncbi:RluA family pseudouridine synthase [Lacticaseibacillus pabuli]|uniref:RNA pseudouridylate synthase n=1 Tax=Lacticaseibacillus pabuli TaxID=3025672 RepID=A0ABY7WTN9_9LACO|nr:RluA family pseudouridine synthase [Lacticaseibacillus sp. KACC 23028]WDF83520.1 RluA family pseudouridine synthase [Lacticaseibacillus sp. KACC 23028]